MPQDYEEDRPRRKLKRRPQKPKEKSFIEKLADKPLVLVGIVFGSLIVVAVVGFFLFRGRFGPKPEVVMDPEGAAIMIQEAGGGVERDSSSPDKPIVGVVLIQTDMRAKQFDVLRAFPKLRKLVISGTKFGNVDVEYIEKLVTLRELSLRMTSVTGSGMSSVAKLVNLEKIDLSQTLVTDDGLDHLKNLKHLKELSLVDTPAMGLGLKAAIPGLKVNK